MALVGAFSLKLPSMPYETFIKMAFIKMDNKMLVYAVVYVADIDMNTWTRLLNEEDNKRVTIPRTVPCHFAGHSARLL